MTFNIWLKGKNPTKQTNQTTKNPILLNIFTFKTEYINQEKKRTNKSAWTL